MCLRVLHSESKCIPNESEEVRRGWIFGSSSDRSLALLPLSLEIEGGRAPTESQTEKGGRGTLSRHCAQQQRAAAAAAAGPELRVKKTTPFAVRFSVSHSDLTSAACESL